MALPCWHPEQVIGIRRWLALGGIVGPATFVAAWSILGAGRSGYSPVHDPISDLAAVDAPTRAAMTAALVAFGMGVGGYAAALQLALPGGAGPAAATAASASLGIAVLPLGTDLGGGPHAAAAAVAYLSLAATPVLGARTLLLRGNRQAAYLSIAAGTTIGASLVASVLTSQGTGLAQRIGLTVADAWIVSTAWMILRGDRLER